MNRPSRRRTFAYHEAAHAVARHFLNLAGRNRGITLARQDLDAHNQDRDEQLHAQGLCYVARSISPIGSGRVDEGHLRQEALALLAGGEAEAIYAGSNGGGGDLLRVIELLRTAQDVQSPIQDRAFEALGGRPPYPDEVAALAQELCDTIQRELDANLEALRSEARVFVVEKWPYIQAVADRLWLRSVLSRDEIEEIISTVEERIANGCPGPG
jgi:ATP-dependent Zn protease